jgi:arylsulfatase A-like enzyme
MDVRTFDPRRGRALGVACVAISASILGFWVVPALIRQAYLEQSFGFLNRIISGRAVHPVEYYLAAWRRLFLYGLGVAAVIASVRAARVLPMFTRLARAVEGSPPWPLVTAVSFAVWVGVLTGIAEGLAAAAVFLIRHHPSRAFQWEAVWMAPISTGLTFGVFMTGVLCVLGLLGWLRGRTIPAPFVGFLVLALAGASLLSDPLLRLAPYAVVVLAAGLAVVGARRVRADPDRWWRRCSTTAPYLAGLLVLTTLIGVLHLPALLEGRRIRALADPPPDAPNVLLIILDTVRASSLGLYGYDLPTSPFLDQWASRGVVFENAIAPAPWTLPSHASFFTGRWPREVGVAVGVHLDDTYPTLAEVLADHGYRTAGFVDNFMNTTEATGLHRGFARYEDYPVNFGRFLYSARLNRALLDRWDPRFVFRWGIQMKRARTNSDDFLRWRRGLPEDRPYFAFLNYMDAHSPYISPPRFREKFPSDKPVFMPRDTTGFSEADLDGTRAAYDAAIAYLDSELDRLIELLDLPRDRRGTILVITSDHGEMFGEHGLFEHGGALYEPVLRVPLLIVYPGEVPAGRRIESPASLRDLAATLTDMALGDVDSRLGGRSLAPSWEYDSAGSAPLEVLAEVTRDEWEWGQSGHDKSAFDGTMHYIRSMDKGEEMYDLSVDPRELTDLSRNDEFADALARLRKMVDDILVRGGESGN